MKSRHKRSSGIVPVLKGPTPLFLLLRSYNYWDFPKGEVNEGEDALRAAIRELSEETGAECRFVWGENYVETLPYASGKVARYYVAEVLSPKIEISKEHHEYQWMTYERAREKLVPRVQKVLDWAHNLVRVEQNKEDK